MNSFYSPDELAALGLKSYGQNVLISKKASLYSPEEMEFGSNVRIDDFCVLSGKIKLGDYIHISTHNTLIAGCYGIEMEDFSGISSRCSIYAESDDYSGNAMSNPMCPEQYRAPYGERILIGRYVVIGAGCVILPGASIGEGAAIGAMSLVTKKMPPWSICIGIPCKAIKPRARKLLQFEVK
ncbi:MAG: acyltransferase [Betaproteobacteria bacterium]|nr:acyltransferase [Betaproteobacteria bacterium]